MDSNDTSPPKIVINERMKEFMQNIMDGNEISNDIRDVIFGMHLKQFSINSAVRNNNFYALDKYGLVIRKEEQNNSKSPFGWQFVDGDPVNIHVSVIAATKQENIRRATLQYLKQRWKLQFEAKGLIQRAMNSLSSDLDSISDIMNYN